MKQTYHHTPASKHWLTKRIRLGRIGEFVLLLIVSFLLARAQLPWFVALPACLAVAVCMVYSNVGYYARKARYFYYKE